MLVFRSLFLAALVLVTEATAGSAPLRSSDLRLIPFPKQAKICRGRCRVGDWASIRCPDVPAAVQVARDLQSDLQRAGVKHCWVKPEPLRRAEATRLLLTFGQTPFASLLPLALLPANKQGYRLATTPGGAVVQSRDSAGLVFGITTLRQLVRSNLRARSLPCLEIADWPSLEYRGYQDDITRGPSPKLAALEREVQIGSLLRMNFFTYYLEHQFAFSKHPLIGPKDGSLTPDELRALVAWSKRFGMEIVGCQQSFGHFGTILSQKEFEPLRETADILNPMNEDSYRLLDDLYSEQAPLLESKLFNVCCDETYGLGTGPSKALVDQIGIGGVYARHIRRVHDLITGKYGKRMMMWHDIILQHPDHLNEIPKDTIMLSWGYHPGESFDSAILPLKSAGFEFFVCPGTSCWNKMLPDFSTAITNIHNYIRDGAKLGALGMLNTVWADSGETLYPCNWHGIAWGAECAWNASTTSIEDFNRRLGAVLFGEKGDHFGQAIALLSKAHSLPGYDALSDARFWRADFGKLSVSARASRKQSRAMLDIVEPALKHLAALKNEARFNADLVDYFIFAAERMKLMATRQTGFIDAAQAYGRAVSDGNHEEALQELAKSMRTLQAIRDAHMRTRDCYRDLWRREKKPYALDRVLNRYDNLTKLYDDILDSLGKAAKTFDEQGKLPSPRDVGLEIVESGMRGTGPDVLSQSALLPESPWTEPGFGRRMGIVIGAGDPARRSMPVEIELPAGVSGPVRLVDVGSGKPIACQIDRVGARNRLAFLVLDDMPKGSERQFFLYEDLDTKSVPTAREAGGVSLKDAPRGMRSIENEMLKLLVGPEGAHIYRWEIKPLGNLDITEPGERDWAGFADINGPNRNATNRIEVTANGPALVRLKCTDPAGIEKTISVWAGVPWVEVTFAAASQWFACYDDTRVMGADSATPGTYLFSDGDTGRIRKTSASFDCQDRKLAAYWGAKFVPGGPLIAAVTPEVAAGHWVGPGSGMGAVGIDGGTAAAHFVIYGGVCPASVRETLDSLRETLDYTRPPTITLYGWQRALLGPGRQPL